MNVSAIVTGNATSGAPAAVTAPKHDTSGRDQAAGAASVGNVQIRQMVAEMQSQISRMSVSLEFSTYGERGEKIAVVVADKQTGEVIREIPAKEIQNLYAKMTELAGILFNRQV